MAEPETLDAYADLALRVGANVRPGQEVGISCLLAHVPLARAVARAAYASGARYVSTLYRDPHVHRALVELGPEESLDWTPPWLVDFVRGLGDRGGALVSITGDPDPTCWPISTPAASGGHGRKRSPRPICATSPSGSSTGRSSRTRTRGGRARSSASRTSTGSGTPSRAACASTSRIPSPRGTTTSRRS